MRKFYILKDTLFRDNLARFNFFIMFIIIIIWGELLYNNNNNLYYKTSIKILFTINLLLQKI